MMAMFAKLSCKMRIESASQTLTAAQGVACWAPLGLTRALIHGTDLGRVHPGLVSCGHYPGFIIMAVKAPPLFSFCTWPYELCSQDYPPAGLSLEWSGG